MANSKSAWKRVRQNTRRADRNRVQRSRIRTFTTKFDAAVAAGNKEEAGEAYKQIVSILDRAAKTNIIPRERAARKAGRMAKRLHAIG